MRCEVFAPDFTPVGSLDVFTALRWVERYNKCGSFELWCPSTKENGEMLKEGNILWIGDKTAGVVEVTQKNVSKDNTAEINIKGRLIESYLSYRILWNTYEAQGKNVSDIMRELVARNCISPTIAERIIPALELNTEQQMFGEKISYQRTGEELLMAIEDLATSHSLGFAIEFRPKDKKLVFTVEKGIDRTIEQSEVPPVVFSSDTEDILSSTYFKNKSDSKTLALVAGEDSGEQRKIETVGAGALLDRRETYVDARDIQSKGTDDPPTPIPEDEYRKMLQQRGLEYLAEKRIVESFDAVIKSFGEQQYVYGIDYKKGDLVTVFENTLNIRVSARITEIERVFDANGESLNLIFGYAQPTLNQKLRFLGLGV